LFTKTINNHKSLVIATGVLRERLIVYSDMLPGAVRNRQWVEVAWRLITRDVRTVAEVAVADICLYCSGESLLVVLAGDQLCGLVNRGMCRRRLVVGLSD
jgi:hypothetical protein